MPRLTLRQRSRKREGTHFCFFGEGSLAIGFFGVVWVWCRTIGFFVGSFFAVLFLHHERKGSLQRKGHGSGFLRFTWHFPEFDTSNEPFGIEPCASKARKHWSEVVVQEVKCFPTSSSFGQLKNCLVTLGLSHSILGVKAQLQCHRFGRAQDKAKAVWTRRSSSCLLLLPLSWDTWTRGSSFLSSALEKSHNILNPNGFLWESCGE